MGDSSSLTKDCDSDTEFRRYTAAQRAEIRQTREDKDDCIPPPDSPQQIETDETDPSQEVSGGGFTVLHYKPATAAPNESSDMEETDNTTDIAGTSWAPLIPAFTIATAATEYEARKHLSLTNGNLQEAVLLFTTNKLSKPQPPPPNARVEEPLEEAPQGLKPPSLLDEALDTARPKRLQRGGEVVIVLDANDLSKTFRLRSEEVSPLFKHELAANAAIDARAHGVKHLFILQKRVDDGTMPLLVRKSLDVLRAECEGEFYQKPTLKMSEERDDERSEQIKAEDAVEADAPTPSKETLQKITCTWIDAYETFIRIIAFPSINSGISKIDVDKALEKIEMVAQIAKVTQAVPSISRALDSVLNTFIQDQQLWSAIAKDAARWLLVGANLEKPLIYNEAFTHVAGCYPEWPWSTPVRKVPVDLLGRISAKSLSLDLMRKKVERELLCISLIEKIEPAAKAKVKIVSRQYVSHQVGTTKYEAVSVFRDWVAVHVLHLDSGEKGPPKVKTAICDHRDNECLTVAGMHQLMLKGGDACLPVDVLLEEYWIGAADQDDQQEAATIRCAFKTLKSHAAKLVAPLLESRLKFEGRDKLTYLTAIDVSDEDVPWSTKTLDSVEDDEDDGDEL